MNRRKRILWLLAACLLLPTSAWAAGASDSFMRNSFALILMITLADACGFLFERLGLPELVGEIGAGVLLGNLALLGIDFNVLQLLRDSEFMSYAAELAVVLLLFIVGLESDMRGLLGVGRNALAVACVGVVAPVLLGTGTMVLLGAADGVSAWFAGAMLAATSVGITAQMLRRRGLVASLSGEVIVGAAVIDDLLGVLLLAVLASIAANGELVPAELFWIIAKALLFFAAALLIGQRLLPGVVHLVRLAKHASIWTGFAFCMALGFAQLAALAGLAPLIGAFLAGLLLDDVTFRFRDTEQEHSLEELIRPIADILLSVFFIGVGAQVQLHLLASAPVLTLALVLTAVAVLSKGIAGLAVRGPGFDRLGIGYAMIPRGEVGLVFAAFALTQGLFSPQTYSALVLVVLMTTAIGPALLKPRLRYFGMPGRS